MLPDVQQAFPVFVKEEIFDYLGEFEYGSAVYNYLLHFILIFAKIVKCDIAWFPLFPYVLIFKFVLSHPSIYSFP